MRLFILLILLSAFAIWFGFYLRHNNSRYAPLAFIAGGILAITAAGGFYGWF